MYQIKRLVVGIIQTNCYIFSSNDEVAIIDPGDNADEILATIDSTQKIKYIINTHYHDDHTLVVEELRKKTKAQVLIHEDEKDFINFTVDQFLKDADEIKIGNEVLKVVLTPGHTKGSICLFGSNFVFVGDVIFEMGYGRTDLPGGSDIEMIKTLQRLNQLIKPGTTVYSGHGEIFKHI